MSDSIRLKYLRIALVGIIFIFGIYSLMIAWPSGWTLPSIVDPDNTQNWSHRNSPTGHCASTASVF